MLARVQGYFLKSLTSIVFAISSCPHAQASTFRLTTCALLHVLHVAHATLRFMLFFSPAWIYVLLPVENNLCLSNIRTLLTASQF